MMAPRTGTGVWAAAAFDRDTATGDEARANAERKRVLAQFPLQNWTVPSLERYALEVGAPDAHDAGTGYCWPMDFRTPHLGSVRGGSAANAAPHGRDSRLALTRRRPPASSGSR